MYQLKPTVNTRYYFFEYLGFGRDELLQNYTWLGLVGLNGLLDVDLSPRPINSLFGVGFAAMLLKPNVPRLWAGRDFVFFYPEKCRGGFDRFAALKTGSDCCGTAGLALRLGSKVSLVLTADCPGVSSVAWAFLSTVGEDLL